MEIDGNGLEVLERHECLRLLDEASIGRIAVTVDALPTVVPVTFRLVEGRILVRTGRGTQLAAATRDTVVAFEADDFDPVDRTGWSVVVTGIASQIDPAQDAAARPARWPSTTDGHVVAITTEMVLGHRVVAHAPGRVSSRPGRVSSRPGR